MFYHLSKKFSNDVFTVFYKNKKYLFYRISTVLFVLSKCPISANFSEKYFFNNDIIRYCHVISGTLQKWPYCYFENLPHTNSYPTIILQITFCTRLPGPKKRQKRAFSPITPRIWDFSDEFSKIGREPIKPPGMM